MGPEYPRYPFVTRAVLQDIFGISVVGTWASSRFLVTQVQLLWIIEWRVTIVVPDQIQVFKELIYRVLDERKAASVRRLRPQYKDDSNSLLAPERSKRGSDMSFHMSPGCKMHSRISCSRWSSNHQGCCWDQLA